MPTLGPMRNAFTGQGVPGDDKARRSIAGPLQPACEELFTFKGVVNLKSIYLILHP